MGTINVKFLHTTKARNSTKIPPTTPSTETLCLLKDTTSVLNPSLIIQGNSNTFEGKSFPDYNYCYIEEFHRYYFVKEIASISANVWQIDCEVDVLASFRTQILASTAFIKRAQTGGSNLVDNMLQITSNTKVTSSDFPWTPYAEQGCYVLSVQGTITEGSEGSATYYVLTEKEMANFCTGLNEPSFWEELRQHYDNPLDNIANCVWLPMAVAQVSSVRTNMYLGGYLVPDCQPWYARRTYSETITFGITVPHFSKDPESYSDFRNIEPYFEAYIFLVGVGLVQLPMYKLIADGSTMPSVTAEYTVDVVTGDIYYQLYRSAKSSDILLTTQGNLATPVAISGTSTGAFTIVKNGASAVMSTVGAVALGMVNPMIGGAMTVGAVSSAMQIPTSIQQVTHVNGSTGGRASCKANDNFSVVTFERKLSDSPSSISSVIGNPVMKKATIGSYSGFVQATGIRLSCEATVPEHEQIERLINGGIRVE